MRIVRWTEPGTEDWVEFNREYSEAWPNITRKGDPPADGADWETVENKLKEHFDPAPGEP